jgi:hypothetical protein
LLAALGAFSADRDAILHVADFLTAVGTGPAHLSAGIADKNMLWHTGEHHRCRRPADFRARYHQPKMFGLDMVSASLKAMIHRLVEARAGTGCTKVHAGPHIC